MCAAPAPPAWSPTASAITNIDPIQNGLLFERFLNPGRISMPDIDLDYPDDRRGEMIAYTAMKYGEGQSRRHYHLRHDGRQSGRPAMSGAPSMSILAGLTAPPPLSPRKRVKRKSAIMLKPAPN